MHGTGNNGDNSGTNEIASATATAQTELQAMCARRGDSIIQGRFAVLRLVLTHLRCLDFGSPSNHSTCGTVDRIVTHSLQQRAALESLILSRTAVTDATLQAVGSCFPLLSALDVSHCSNVTQEGIDVFGHLRFLDVSDCCGVYRLPPNRGRTLRTLHAAGMCRIDNAALCADDGAGGGGGVSAGIVALDVRNNPRITTVSPFASTLRELHASGYLCGISDAALMNATRIVKLNVSCNFRVTTVAPFASTLRELDACGMECGISDEGLRDVTHLVALAVNYNRNVTTVAPFAATLRELDATGHAGVGSAGLQDAIGIVRLNVRSNSQVTTVAPFAATLRELDASGEYCGLWDAGLMDATGIVKLIATENPHMSTVSPFAATLRELHASGKKCGVNDAGLADASGIVKLSIASNPGVTALTPFARTLLDLDAHMIEGMCGGLTDEGLAVATELVKLRI